MSIAPVCGVRSDGLCTTVLPVATAAPIKPQAIATGAFHGVITATTPRGSRTMKSQASRPPCRLRHPCRAPSSAYWRSVPIPASTRPSASPDGLPISAVTSAASSSTRSSTARAAARRAALRSAAGAAAQPGAAPRAAAIAAAASAGVDTAATPSGSPVAGSATENTSCPVPWLHRPPASIHLSRGRMATPSRVAVRPIAYPAGRPSMTAPASVDTY